MGLLLSMPASYAAEFKTHGIIDLRLTSNDSLDSYLSGGYGKFSSNDSAALSISQAAAQFSVIWNSGLSANLVFNSYSENDQTELGITEAYFKYKSLPSEQGFRWENRSGIFYPKISLENEAFAWASINTLNSSTLNTWIGEETRLLGSEIKVTRLGKFNDANFDVSLSATVFGSNDPTGALLSWHGWTMSNRQTNWRESKPFPDFPASRSGQILQHQAKKSNPFLEIDDRLGYQFQFDWKQHQKGKFSVGYYDNRAKPYIVKDGQYGWDTHFIYVGAKWKLAKDLEITSQILNGSTLMQSAQKTDVVNNNFQSAFVSLTKRSKKHKYTLRLEEFSVTDNDQTKGDNNTEYGKAATLNYTYRLSKPWFLSTEYNWIQSDRPSRMYSGKDAKLIERQIQFAARYFF
jgi:hypothetical protein